MINNEKFIHRWSRYMEKGKFKYILSNSIICCVVYWGISILLLLVKGKELHNLIEKSDDFMIFFIVYIISSFIMWKRNEDKYNEIINNNKA